MWRDYMPHAEIWFGEYDAACVDKHRSRLDALNVRAVTGDQGDAKTVFGWLSTTGVRAMRHHIAYALHTARTIRRNIPYVPHAAQQAALCPLTTSALCVACVCFQQEAFSTSSLTMVVTPTTKSTHPS